MKIAEHRARVAAALLVIVSLGLLIFSFERGWLSGEPVYRGRTVTEWLDKLVLYEYQTVPEATRIVMRPPEAIVQDPAYHALMKISSDGVPVFVKVLSQRADWPRDINVIKRWKMWIQWRWHQLRGSQASRPAPRNWSEAQRARKTAAGFALIALGTNGGGGFSKYMDVYAVAPKHQSIYGTGVSGTSIGVISSEVVRYVISVLPERREEVVGEVLTALDHTNMWHRSLAVECTWLFHRELLQRRKDQFVKLTRDENPLVQQGAVGRLMMIVQDKSVADLMPRDEVAQIARALLDDPGTSERAREVARIVLELATKP